MIQRSISIALLFCMLGLLAVANQIAFSNLEFPLIGATGEKIFGAGTINQMRFSSEGQLITGGSLGVLIWNPENGELLNWVARYPSHKEPVLDFAVSPDGKQIFTGSSDRSARLWDRATGDLLLTLENLTGSVVSVGFSADGKQLFTAAGDSLRVWDAKSGALLRSIPVGLEVYKVWFSNQRNYAFVRSIIDRDTMPNPFYPEGTINPNDTQISLLIDLESGGISPLGQNLSSEYVYDADFSPNGDWIAVSNQKGVVKIWDIPTGQLAAQIVDNATYGLQMEFSPDGSRLLTSVRNQDIKLWNTATQTVVETIPNEDLILNIAFSSDGKKLALYKYLGVYVWDQTSKSITNEINLFRHTSFPSSLSPDGKRIVTADTGRMIWNVDTGRIIGRADDYDMNNVSNFTPDGKKVLMYDGRNGKPDFSLWEVEPFQMVYRKSVLENSTPTARDRIQHAEISPDGNLILICMQYESAFVWDTKTGSKVAELPVQKEATLWGTFTSDSKKVFLIHRLHITAPNVTTKEKDTILHWDITTGIVSQIATVGHIENTFTSERTVLSPDQKFFVKSSTDPAEFGLSHMEVKYLSLFSTLTGATVQLFAKSTRAVTGWEYSSDSTKIVSSGLDNTIRVWDSTTLSEIKALTGHTDYVPYVQFSKDGSYVLSTGRDGTIRLWDIGSKSLTPVSDWSVY